MALFDYTLEAISGHARAGSFETAHGIVNAAVHARWNKCNGKGHSPRDAP